MYISRKSNTSARDKIARDVITGFKSSPNNLFFSYNVPEFNTYSEVSY